MTFAKEIVCPRCDNRFALAQLLNLCACGSPAVLRSKESCNRALQSRPPGPRANPLRYRELLPLQDDANLISLGEGFTPSLKQRRWDANSACGGSGSKTRPKIPQGRLRIEASRWPSRWRKSLE
jgi:threonine synthase